MDGIVWMGLFVLAGWYVVIMSDWVSSYLRKSGFRYHLSSYAI